MQLKESENHTDEQRMPHMCEEIVRVILKQLVCSCDDRKQAERQMALASVDKLWRRAAYEEEAIWKHLWSFSHGLDEPTDPEKTWRQNFLEDNLRVCRTIARELGHWVDNMQDTLIVFQNRLEEKIRLRAAHLAEGHDDVPTDDLSEIEDRITQVERDLAESADSLARQQVKIASVQAALAASI